MDDSTFFGFSVDTTQLDEVSGGGVATGLGIGGTFYAECYGPDGKLKWACHAKNIIPNAVLNDVLNVYFGATSQTSTFYMGLVDNNGFSAFAATDTMASHSGWTENVQISNSARPTWTPGAASNQSIANGTQVVFNMTPSSGCTIKGFFLASNNTLNGTSGNLAAEAALATVQPCNNGDTLKVTYTINGTTS